MSFSGLMPIAGGPKSLAGRRRQKFLDKLVTGPYDWLP